MADAITSIPEYSPSPEDAARIRSAVDAFRESLGRAAVQTLYPIYRKSESDCAAPPCLAVVVEPFGLTHNKKRDVLQPTPGLAIARFPNGRTTYSAHMVDWMSGERLRTLGTFPLALLGPATVEELIANASAHIADGSYASWATTTNRFKADIRIPSTSFDITPDPLKSAA